jgi:hypothetical protein
VAQIVITLWWINFLDCRTRVVLKKSGEVLDLVPPPSKVHNLIFGRTWIDSPGDMVLTNLTTGDKVVLYFQPCGWFGKGRYEVDGYVYSKDEEPQLMVTGKWNTTMSYQPCDVEGEPLPGTELKEVFSSLSLKSAHLTSLIFVAFPFGLLHTLIHFMVFAFFTILFIMILL